jgi:hypothetical protein
MSLHIVLVQIDIPGFNGEFASLGHCVPSIDGKIHDDLLNPSWVGIDLSQTWLSNGNELDIFANHTAKH